MPFGTIFYLKNKQKNKEKAFCLKTKQKKILICLFCTKVQNDKWRFWSGSKRSNAEQKKRKLLLLQETNKKKQSGKKHNAHEATFFFRLLLTSKSKTREQKKLLESFFFFLMLADWTQFCSLEPFFFVLPLFFTKERVFTKKKVKVVKISRNFLILAFRKLFFCLIIAMWEKLVLFFEWQHYFSTRKMFLTNI